MKAWVIRHENKSKYWDMSSDSFCPLNQCSVFATKEETEEEIHDTDNHRRLNGYPMRAEIVAVE